MDLSLSNGVVIVTCASRGIGRSIVETFSFEGMRIVLVARSRDQLEALSCLLPTESLVLAVDMCRLESAQQVITSAIDGFGRLDVVDNNAGATRRGDFRTLTDDEWQDGFAPKFDGTMRLIVHHGHICRPFRG